MKHLKKYKSFLEDGTATVTATTAGMGDVVNSQPGDLPGTTGTKGSGDITSYLFDKKGKKIKKGSPSQVSDARFLAPAKSLDLLYTLHPFSLDIFLLAKLNSLSLGASLTFNGSIALTAILTFVSASVTLFTMA